MKVYRLFPLLLTAFLGGCYTMDVPEPEKPDSVVKLSLDDDPYALKDPIGIGYETSCTLTFEYEDISRITASAPAGWTAVVKMSGGSGSLKVSAPKYGEDSVQSGDIVLKIYDGTGSFFEKKFPVYAIESELEFEIPDFDFSAVNEFTLGSRTTVRFNCSPSFKNIEFDLPAGWKGIEKTRGTFTIIAPDLTEESGDAEGTVTVTPVSWGGMKSSELAKSFPVHVDATKPTFQFVDEEVSFTFGETRELEITAKGLKNLVTPETPEGWNIDWSGILDGTVKVTAPAKGTDTFACTSVLQLSAVSNADNSAISSNSSVIRLYGINSAQELLDFRAVYEAEDIDDPDVSEEAIGKWMSDGELCLNTDITLTTEMLHSKAYIIKYLNLPLEGNNHTINIDFECNATRAGIFQYNNGDIRNLKLAGKLINSYEGGVSHIGPLVANPLTAVIENVECSVDVTYNVGTSVLVKSIVGGIGGFPAANYAPTFRNCKYSGTITCNNDAFSVGGIVGSTDTGKPGAMTTVEGCTFSGNIILNHLAENTAVTSRVGGMLGDLARQGTIVDCVSDGNITINAGGNRYASSNGFGFGGICGRITAPASGYTMSAVIKNARFSGTIKVNGTAGNEDKTRYGQILGCSPNDNATNILTKENWIEEGTISL